MSAQSDDELRQKAFKRIIDICEDSISKDDIHMTIQCEKCAECKTCKDIRKINASSYNDFMEQQVMEQLVKFIEGKDGEPGYFISPLPLKPFNINSVRGNRATADEQNKKMLEKLQLDPTALQQVKDEMEKLQEAGFIAKLEDLPEETQRHLNEDFKHYIPTSITFKDQNLLGQQQKFQRIQLPELHSVKRHLRIFCCQNVGSIP